MENLDTLFFSPEFVLGAKKISDFPADGKPHFPFIGRSNVGKSSLLNALFHKKKVAYVSKTPGKTSEVNFFSLKKRAYISDMPGYGFAIRSKSQIQEFETLIRDYLTQSPYIKNLYILINGQHGIKKADEEFLEFILFYRIPFTIVLTKIDRTASTLLQSLRTELQSRFIAPLLETSATKNKGIDVLRRDIIQRLCQQENSIHIH